MAQKKSNLVLASNAKEQIKRKGKSVPSRGQLSSIHTRKGWNESSFRLLVFFPVPSSSVRLPWLLVCCVGKSHHHIFLLTAWASSSSTPDKGLFVACSVRTLRTAIILRHAQEQAPAVCAREESADARYKYWCSLPCCRCSCGQPIPRPVLFCR